MSDNSVRIDKEFKALIPPLTDEERAGLESNVQTDGCRDALVVWASGNVLLDGHNRYIICQKHGIGFKVKKIDLDDRKAAINWIINNQLHRRNLTPKQASYLRGQRYNREKMPRGRVSKESRKNCDSKGGGRTERRLAEEYKVAYGTIANDGHFAAAVEKLTEAHGPKIKQRILQHDSGLTKKAVIEAAAAPEKQQLAILENPPKRSKPKTQANGKLPADKRAAQIRPLAAESYRANQIAEQIGISTQQVRNIARQFSIELIDQTIGKTRQIDAERVVGETVASVEGLAMGLNLIDSKAVSALGKRKCEQWHEALSEAMKPLNRLRKQLSEACK